VLSEEDAARVDAAVQGMATFVDTLILVTETQDAIKREGKAQQASATAKDDGQAEPMSIDQPVAVLVCRLLIVSMLSSFLCSFNKCPNQCRLSFR
jgi:hypothetical protein